MTTVHAAILTLSILAILGGFVVTWLPFDGPDWRLWVALRAILQLGGCATLGWIVADKLDHAVQTRARYAALAAAIGLTLCWAPVLDLIEGPTRLERAEPAVYVERWTMNRRPHQRQEICFRDVEHRLACIAPLAPKILWVGPRVSRCDEGQSVDVSVLRHLEVVVAVECRAPAGPPPADPYLREPPPGAARAGYALLEELRSVPPEVAERRARMALLANVTTLYTVAFGSGPDDAWGAGLLRQALAQRDDVSRSHLQRTLRETYGVTE